jgi:MFS family permease
MCSHTIAFEQLLTVLFSMPESTTPPELPFKFTGGFDLSTKDIGFILSCQGLLQMFAQLIVFPMVTKRLGPLWTFRLAVFGYPILYLLVPYLPLVPHQFRLPAIGFVLVWKVTNQAFSYPSNSLMLVDAAPSPRVLGTLNGISSAAASLARAFGPTLAGVIQAAGLSIGYLGFPWWGCSLVAICGAFLSLHQRHVPRKEIPAPVSEIISDEESGLAGPILAAFLETDSTDGEEANLSSKPNPVWFFSLYTMLFCID